ncbi:homoserine dehydrogenase [Halalkalibacillus sediminis]|uniref:homoserine dehydrogenase n=1 Tax=Halalkalibacillus sediminis TaxID=2018042 RepID=UPI0026BBB3EA
MNIAFIGFGGVGQALAQILLEKNHHLNEKYGLNTKIVAVSDVMKGSVYDPEGLNIEDLLSSVKEKGSVEEYPDSSTVQKGLNSIQTIEDTNADMIVEVTFTDVETGQPAIDHCETAFQKGKSVVTTNKGPAAVKLNSLLKLAEENGAFFGFEGTVMSGTPALRLPETTLAGNDIREVVGILNGTTNYILTEMEKGLSFEDSLKQAQSLGYAEADPTNDVEGYDVRYKAAILANYVLGEEVSAKEIHCEGIRSVSQDMVQDALDEGKRWKLLARIKKEDGKVEATVQPEKIEMTNPLAGVTGATNAILYDCDLAGPIMLTGAGAGLKETGFSLLIDIIHAHLESKKQTSGVR